MTPPSNIFSLITTFIAVLGLVCPVICGFMAWKAYQTFPTRAEMLDKIASLQGQIHELKSALEELQTDMKEVLQRTAKSR